MTDTSFAYLLRTRRHAAGMTQRELAERSGVKQPLIAALERGTRTPTESAQEALLAELEVRPSALIGTLRDSMIETITRNGGAEPRVFGSVARGEDEPGSDVDLLVTFAADADIVSLLALEDELSRLLTTPVDIVSARGTGAAVYEAIRESVPL